MSKSKGIFYILLTLVLIMAMVALTKSFFLPLPEAVKLTAMTESEYDPAAWGKHYPLQYESYLKNKEMAPSPTGFGGSVNYQKSTKEPEILVNFKGMPFSKDYTEDRGHPYALEDLKASKRVGPASPGACMTCKSSQLNETFLTKGWDFAKVPLLELLPGLKHSIVCQSCHDPKTMNLRVTIPAFVEAMERRGVDVRKASRQEMRSYVCAQCHSEYYFEPEAKRVVFPWDSGFTAQDIYAYYQGRPRGFEMDWAHPDSGAKMLKAQHPEYELFIGGVHAKSGVACADCHMPYVRKKGKKYSSHWVTSPLRTTQNSCRTCHDQDDAWLLERVKRVQNQVWEIQRTAGMTIARAHETIGKAGKGAKTNREELEKARELIRKAQWYWDYVAAENSMGFHNPDQALSTLGQAIDLAHQAADAANRADLGRK